MQKQFTDNFNSYHMREVPSGMHPSYEETGLDNRREEHHPDVLAKERLEAAGRLAAWVAHQINNPLGAISGNAQLLARRLTRDIDDPELLQEYLKYIDGIQGHTERCAKITGEMLNFTRPGEPDMRAVDIHLLVSDVLDLIKYAYPDREVLFFIEDPLPKACADPDWLSRILFELIANAVQESGSEPVRIFVSCLHDMIEAEIRDAGSGIDAEIIPRLFDPFFSTREKSRGLGLTISLDMAKKMGGDIRLAESSEKGSAFVAAIPVWGQRD